MFGISWAEFLVIFLVAVAVIPARLWPDVARFLARAIKTVRSVIWRIADASERVREQIELEQPIDQVIKSTTDDMLAGFATPLAKSKKPGRHRSRTGVQKK